MKPPSIAVLLGRSGPQDEGDDAPEMSSRDDSGDDDVSDLSPTEIVEHLHTSAEEALKAVDEKSPQRFLRAIKAIIGLVEAQGDSPAPEKDEPSEEEV